MRRSPAARCRSRPVPVATVRSRIEESGTAEDSRLFAAERGGERRVIRDLT
ncbi:hypothetical protein [Streptomyces sp. LN785]|uniref:hypothetical protein n=1 Tax=Streptomyces sp. LN785 TaxID=3112983 RepID=UPI00371262A7